MFIVPFILSIAIGIASTNLINTESSVDSNNNKPSLVSEEEAYSQLKKEIIKWVDSMENDDSVDYTQFRDFKIEALHDLLSFFMIKNVDIPTYKVLVDLIKENEVKLTELSSEIASSDNQIALDALTISYLLLKEEILETYRFEMTGRSSID